MGLLDHILNRRASADRSAAASAPAQVAPPPGHLTSCSSAVDTTSKWSARASTRTRSARGRRSRGRACPMRPKPVLLPGARQPLRRERHHGADRQPEVGYLCRDDPAHIGEGFSRSRRGIGPGSPSRRSRRWRRAAGRPRTARCVALHDPADFGLTPISPAAPALAGSMRTGLTEALLTDAEDAYRPVLAAPAAQRMRRGDPRASAPFLNTIPIHRPPFHVLRAQGPSIPLA